MTSNIILRFYPSNWLSFEARKEENEKKAKVYNAVLVFIEDSSGVQQHARSELKALNTGLQPLKPRALQ